MKGIGTGLNLPIHAVDVWLGGGQPAVVSGWSIHQVDPATGLVAAVAGADAGGWTPGIPHRVAAPHSDWLTPLTATSM